MREVKLGQVTFPLEIAHAETHVGRPGAEPDVEAALKLAKIVDSRIR